MPSKNQSAATPRIPELLAPAGTMDALKAALAAGADAVYLGLDAFNARRNAENFTIETLATACELAHLAGSRVYVTMNILIGQDELPRAVRLVHDAWVAGADAFIVQDWGLLSVVHELWPQVELHLSTQANVADPIGVRHAAGAGCARVTLARELTLPEIAACCATGTDIEVFAHGALCVCYSGECLLSSMQRGRSANRGLCRQPCRLPYEMLDESGRDVARVGGTRLLSPKDCCTIGDLEALARAGVGALKIEGRMKAPDYVATVVGTYRRALDDLRERLDVTADAQAASGAGREAVALTGAPGGTSVAEMTHELRTAFNRDFTDGYLRGDASNDIMSYERGNNRGMLVGEVVGARLKTATIRFDDDVHEGDLLEVRNPDRFDDYVTSPSPADVMAGTTREVRLPRAMPAGCAVRLIRSEGAMARARAYAARTYPRKRRVTMDVRAVLGEPLLVGAATVAGDAHPALDQRPVRAVATGPVVEAARTRVVTRNDLIDHVGRMGSTPFEPCAWDVTCDDGVGMAFSAVHATRTDALDRLRAAILAPWASRAADTADAPYSIGGTRGAEVPGKTPDEPEACALVSSPRQAELALEAGATRLYALVEDLAIPPAGADEGAWADAWPRGVIPLVGEVGRAADLDRARSLVPAASVVAAGTVAAIDLAREAGARVESWDTIELHNAVSYDVLAGAGADCVWISPELELLEIAQVVKAARPVTLGIVASGHQRVMTTEHCVLQSQGPCGHRCPACARRRERVTLRDEFGRTVLVTSDALGRSRLWETAPLDITPQIPALLDAGVTRFLADTRILRDEDVPAAVSRVVRALRDARAGRMPQPRLAGATSGHIFSRIG